MQDQDFEPLTNESNVFSGIDGRDVPYDGPEEKGIVALFINEAAYYEKDVAFCTATPFHRRVVLHDTAWQ